MGSRRDVARVCLGLALFASLAPRAGADPPRLVLDAATDLSNAPGSQPRAFTSLGDAAVFVAFEEDRLERLWRSDGTLGGTFAIGPACPGSSIPQIWQLVGTLPGVALFSFYCEGSGTALWRTDGSAEGTFELLDYSGEYAVLEAVPFAGRLLFAELPTPYAYVERLRLWTTDGTLAGTRRVVDRALGGWARVGAAVAATDRVELVVMMLDSNSPVLWRSGGDEASTRVVEELDGSLFSFGGIESIAFGRFVAHRSRSSQLWVSDGTAAGTGPVTAFADPDDAFLFDLWDADGERLLFVADDGAGEQVWESDGSAAGTRALTRFEEPTGLQFFEGPHTFVALDERVVFYANDDANLIRLLGVDRASGEVSVLAEPCAGPDAYYSCRYGLWLERLGERAVFPMPVTGAGAIAATDGTPAGTFELARLCPVGCDAAPRSPALIDGELFVAADVAAGAVELWSFDDEGRATFRGGGVREILAPYEGALDLARVGDLVLLGAADARHGFEPFRAVPGGVELELVEDLRFDRAGSNLEAGVALGGELYLPVNGRVLRSDGTPEGTVELIAPPAAWCSHSNPGVTADLRPLAARLLIANGDCEQGNLWSYDPATGELATLLGAARPDRPAFESIQSVAGGEADFLVGDYSTPGSLALWSTDGTESGTRFRVALPDNVRWVVRYGELRVVGCDDLFVWEPGAPTPIWVASGANRWFAPFGAAGGRAILRSGEYTTGKEGLVAVDAAGALEPLVEFEYGTWIRSAQEIGGRLLFRVDDPGPAFPDLWVTDGSAEGTALLASFGPATSPSEPAAGFQPLGSRFALVGVSPAGGMELWASDGTPAGTERLDLFGEAGQPLEVTAFASTGSRVFLLGFPAGDGGVVDFERLELWSSPALPGAAERVADWPWELGGGYPGDTAATLLVAAGDRIYCAGGSAESGVELWSSDGSVAGTARVADIAPGPASSGPAVWAEAGGKLFFWADDGLTGYELWSYDPADAALCRASSTSLCLQGGRFRVEAGWMDFEGVQGQATAVPLTSDSGAFWFFEPGNVELVGKVLDGTALFGHHWVFYGALSNVRYALTVRDGLTGAARRYLNPAGTYASVGDSAAFGPLGASATSAPAPREEPARGAGSTWTTAGPASGACAPGPTRLCLREGRFAVEAAWRDFQGNEGVGSATPWAGGESGTFWFFDAANVELIVKVLDGTPINGRWWVYYGALSNVEYTVTVTDTLTGTVRTYLNPAGTFASVGDVDAF